MTVTKVITTDSFRTVSEAVKDTTHTLAAAGCDTPRLDAEVLLAYVLGYDRAWLYAHPEYWLSPTQWSGYQSLISRRARREPVAYLTGNKEFFGLDLVVTHDVLIPRPETERLVEIALRCAPTLPPPYLIVDVGTGSGAIAVALAVHLPRAHLIALDASAAALAIARRNAARQGVARRIYCIQADLLAPLAGPLALIVANPPYLSPVELKSAPPEVAHWEPHAALNGGPDGLAIIRRLLTMAADRLQTGGVLLMEIGAAQGAATLRLAGRHFPQADAEIIPDYAGHDRLLVLRRG